MKNRILVSLLCMSILTTSIQPMNNQPSHLYAIAAYLKPFAVARSLGFATYGSGLAAYGAQLNARATGILINYIQPNTATWYQTIINLGIPQAPSMWDMAWQGHAVAKSWIPFASWNPLSFTLPPLAPAFAVDPTVLSMVGAGVGCACLGTLLAYVGFRNAHRMWNQMKQPIVPAT